MIIKLLTQIFTSTIRSQKFDRLAELILYFILKLLELFKGFRLMPHQVDISISAQVVGESHEVLVTTSSSRAHWSTHISMYEFQQVGRPLATLCKRCLGHLAVAPRLRATGLPYIASPEIKSSG